MSYFRIPEKYSGNDKKETQGYMKDPDKQKLRKKENSISRVLDNYYNPKIHQRAWMPNGRFIRKKLYSYADSGLGYFYEKNNVEQKKDTIDMVPRNKQKVGQSYIEFEYLNQNEFNITIEYCANCEEHQIHTRHSPVLFKNYASYIQQCINLRFPFISVMLKPIDTDILQEEVYNKKLPKLEKNGGSYQNRPFINEKFKDVRIGAFEIQITKKNNKGDIETALIHSKLRTGKWPKIPKVLDKIVSFLPTFNGEIHLFEKEELESLNENNLQENNDGYNDSEQKQEDESIFISKLLGIQVNIYLFKNERISQIIQQAESELEIELDPKKRLEQNYIDKKMAKENPYNNCSVMSANTTYLTRVGSARTRIESAKTRLDATNNSFAMTRQLSTTRAASANPLYKNRPKSSMTAKYSTGSMSYSGYCFNNQLNNVDSSGNILGDKKYSEKFKGTLIITKYTDKEGIIKFGPIPYDSYFIEVVESNEFKFVGCPLTFNKILPNNEIFKKYIGLMIQDDAFVQIHVYQSKKENNEEELVHVPESSVTIQTYYDGTTSVDVLNRREIKLNILEVRTGIFEHMVDIGKYLIEVSRLGYETVRKVCDFEKGLNCVNIEMIPNRKYVFKIRVLNLVKFFIDEKIDFMKNCEVYVYRSSSDLLINGVTDKNGSFDFINNDDSEILTIIVKKLGYRPMQRTYVKTKNVPINENNDYEQVLNFYLVSDNFFEQSNVSALIMAYSNILDENFSFADGEETNTQNMTLNQLGNQANTGIYCMLIQYDEKEEQEDENEKEEEEYDEILPISLQVNTSPLLVPNDQELSREMNGVEKYSCQTIIYTKRNSFMVPAPSYCENDFKYWNIGWLDVKNSLFYEVNSLNRDLIMNNSIFDKWLDFIQKILDEKIYEVLFEHFSFDVSGTLTNDDRTILPELFMKKLTAMNICGEEGKGDIEKFITETMKGIGGNISYSLFKRKIITNIKNFKEEIDFAYCNPMTLHGTNSHIFP